VKGTAVARRYAKALIDLATRDNTIAEMGEELQQHLELLQSNVQLQTLLRNPGLAVEVKTNVLTAILEHTQPTPLLHNFLLLLLKNDRLQHLDAICDHYERMANEKLRQVKAQVTTATALDEGQAQAVEQKIAAMTQKDVLMEKRVDPSILGGLVVRINHVVLDGSLRGQLNRLRQELIEE
jgi:F-type H+-transporting ATPase subunit delta